MRHVHETLHLKHPMSKPNEEISMPVPKLADYHVPLFEAPFHDPCCFAWTIFCPCLAQVQLRKKALQFELQRYKCCQGYYNWGPFQAGYCMEKCCPNCCLCFESCCCHCCAVEATKLTVREMYHLRPDPWETRVDKYNNKLQSANCCIGCLACCFSTLSPISGFLCCCSNGIDTIITFCFEPCVTSQLNVELNHQNNNNNGYLAPHYNSMSRV